MFWSILAIVFIWAFIFLREGRNVAFLIAVTLSLIWIIPTELAGWQAIWWVRWIISPLVLGLVWFLSIRWSVLFRFHENYKQNVANEMDKFFGDVPSEKRNHLIESIIYKSIGFSKELNPNEIITKEDLPKIVHRSYGFISPNERPAYLLAETYTNWHYGHHMYAVMLGEEVLKDIDCFHKDHLIGMYKWLSQENIASQLFDEKGNSKIPGNPLLYK